MKHKIDNKKVKYLVFDLGAVLLNIDLSRFTQRIQNLLGSAAFSLSHEKLPFYEDFERGALNETDFFKLMQQQLGTDIPILDLKEAWSRILLNANLPAWDFLKKTREAGYETYLLSNTNAAHRKQFDQIFDKELGNGQFYKHFNEVFYSHEMGFVKPEKAIYQETTKQANIEPEHCLFIDDKKENVEAAQICNWQAWQFTCNDDWARLSDLLLW